MDVVCWDMMSIGERRSTLQDEYYMKVAQVELEVSHFGLC